MCDVAGMCMIVGDVCMCLYVCVFCGRRCNMVCECACVCVWVCVCGGGGYVDMPLCVRVVVGGV